MELKYWQPVSFLVSLATVAVWWVGGNLVILGTIQLGVVTAFLAYLGMFYSPIQQLSSIMPYIQSALTSGERLREVFDSDTALDNKHGKTADLKKDIVFKDVWFGYDPLFPVIKGISTTFRSGKITAVVGKSGAGKSTIEKILLGLYLPDSGSVLFGGTDIKKIDIKYLRSRIAYVPQESTFFDNTISYNMSYSAENPDKMLIIAVAKAVEMHHEVMKLPLSYDNRIRGRGLSLSGGQRQRLAIARAMLSSADVVVLDEITSSLDVINSRKVNQAVLKLQKEKTIISITHDVNEITNSDYAIVLKDGLVAEQGRTPDLIRKKGELKKMFKYKFEDRVRRHRETGKSLFDYLGGIVIGESMVTITGGKRKSFVNISFKGRKYNDVVPKRPFPVSDPNIVLFYHGKDDSNKEIFALRDYTKLDRRSMEALDRTLEISNYNPKVIKIRYIHVTGDGLDWRLITNKGEMSVLTKNRSDVLNRGEHVILIDEYNTPLKISLADLDEESIKRLKETI
jgi:ATP-binding cassette subfamily C protein